MRKLITGILLSLAAFGADLVCESNNSASATYSWDNPSAWNCYGQGKVAVANEYPGKNYQTNNYIVVLGLTTNSNIVTEHAMNVDAALGVLGKNYARMTVTGAADSAATPGIIRVTTATNTVATGDKLFCYNFNGSAPNNAYGIWTATAIDGTHFDLQGSSSVGIGAVTSGYCEFPAALKRQGYASNANTVGKWKINANVTATFRGDVVDSWGYGTIQGTPPYDDTAKSFWMVRCGDDTNGGCTWVWDGSGPTAYKVTYDTALSPTTVHQSFYVHGTTSRHAVLTCLAGGSACASNRQGTFTGYRNYYTIAGVDMDWVDISNLGVSDAWLTVYMGSASVFKLRHFTISNSGYIRVANGSALSMPAAQFSIAYGKFGSCGPTNQGCLTGFGGATEMLTVGPAVVFEATNTPLAASASASITFDRVYFSMPPASLASAPGSAAANSIIAKPSSVGASASHTFGLENLVNSYVWQFGPNGYMANIPAISSGNTPMREVNIVGNVFAHDSGYDDADDQMLDDTGVTSLAAGVSAPVWIRIHDNIAIPNYTFDGNDATAWHSSNSLMIFQMTIPSSSLAYKVYNNTWFGTTDGANAAPMNADHTGNHQPTGRVAEYRCNAAIVSPATSGAHALLSVETTSTANVDVFTPSGIHHNAGFGNLTAVNDANTQQANGTYYNLPMSSVPAGAPVALGGTGSDQYYPNKMPRFVDHTRRLRTWAMQKYGSTLTDWMTANHPGTDMNASGNDADAYVLEFLRADYNRMLDIPDLVSWVKAGWTMKEPTLYRACGDGTSIGALVMRPNSGNSTMFAIP